MRYLVNRETKEHEVYDGQNYDAVKYRVVDADEEGWIKWHGGAESPLPYDCLCEIKEYLGDFRPAQQNAWDWTEYYRPILDKPDKEFLEACNNSAGAKYAEGFNAAVDRVLERAIEEAAAEEVRLPTLLDRLKAAHEAAQRIPEMEAELDAELKSMGYFLGKLSPFVDLTQPEPLGAEFESALMNNLNKLYDDNPEPPDMSDWRNWSTGDLVERVRDPVKTCAKLGGVYRLTRVDTTQAGTERAWYIAEDGSEVWSSPNNFRWHSRP